MYTIKNAADLVGLSESTLRAWERRYGVGASARTQAGYRVYDEGDLQTLRSMKSLVDAGWSVRLAADEVRSRAAEGTPVVRTPEAGRSAKPLPLEAGVDELVPYAVRFDVHGLSALLDQRFGQSSFETVVDDWLLPALQRIGTGWEAGEVSVAGEHFVSHAVVRRLAASYDAAGENRAGPQVVLGLAPGSRHDLGLLCFATAARRAGLGTRYLGTDVPLSDWERAVRPPAVACAVIAVPRAEDVACVGETVARLRAVRPGLLVALGGSHQEAVSVGGDDCVHLGHRVGAGAALLAEHLVARGATGSPAGS